MTLGSDSLSQRELSENAFSFSYKGFLSRTLTTHRAGGEGRGPSFIPTTYTHSWTFRHLFATLHVRCYHVFLIAPLVFTRLLLDELSNYHLIDWWYDVSFFVCLLGDLSLAFLSQQFETENRWTRTLIELGPRSIIYGSKYPRLDQEKFMEDSV